MLFRDFDRIDLEFRHIFWPNNLSQPPRSKIKQTKNNLKTLNLVPIFVLGLLDDFLRKKICHFKMAAEEKLGVPSNEFFAAVKYHAVGSLQDQVSLNFSVFYALHTLCLDLLKRSSEIKIQNYERSELHSI